MPTAHEKPSRNIYQNLMIRHDGMCGAQSRAATAEPGSSDTSPWTYRPMAMGLDCAYGEPGINLPPWMTQHTVIPEDQTTEAMRTERIEYTSWVYASFSLHICCAGFFRVLKCLMICSRKSGMWLHSLTLHTWPTAKFSLGVNQPRSTPPPTGQSWPAAGCTGTGCGCAAARLHKRSPISNEQNTKHAVGPS